MAGDGFVVDGNILKEYKGNDEVVTIPDGVKTIDKSLFYENYTLKKVIMPDSVTAIKDRAFNSCAHLEEVVFSKKLTTIGPYAFGGDRALTTLDLSNTRIKTIRKKCFVGCENLERGLLPETLKSIEDQAFMRTSIKELRFPAPVEKIAPSAFWRSLTDLYFEGADLIETNIRILGRECKEPRRLHCIKGSDLWYMFESSLREMEAENSHLGQYMPKLVIPELVEL